VVSGGIVVDAGAHEEADDLVALLIQQEGGHRAVHPSGHGQYNTRRHDVILFWDRFSIANSLARVGHTGGGAKPLKPAARQAPEATKAARRE
jgi:hypothetical protein